MKFRCAPCAREYVWTDDNKYSLNGYIMCNRCFSGMAKRDPVWAEKVGYHHRLSDECFCKYDYSCCEYDDEPDVDYPCESEHPLLKKCEICIGKENNGKNGTTLRTEEDKEAKQDSDRSNG